MEVLDCVKLSCIAFILMEVLINTAYLNHFIIRILYHSSRETNDDNFGF